MSRSGVVVRARATRTWALAKRVVVGTWLDGFVFAGNLAYLSLLTLFPFFIAVAAIAGSFGRTDDGLRAVDAFLRTVPPDVGTLVAAPIRAVIAARSGGGLLTFGVLVTLWTVSGFIETIREIIRRAYGTTGSRAAWQYRVGAFALIIGAIGLMLLAFAFQVALTAAEEVIARVVPLHESLGGMVGIGRIAPPLAIFVGQWLVFYALTPRKYRGGACPIWPGALVTTTVWIATTMLLLVALGVFGGYDLTYGSLAGVIVALLFFYIIGLGVVVGAQLNAALAIVPKVGQNAREIAAQGR